MASRKFDAINSLTKKLIVLSGSFQAKGAGAPVVLTGVNSFTVTRTATGLFTIQFADNYEGLACPNMQIQQATPANTVSVVLSANTSTTPGAYVNILIGTFATPATAVDITQTSTDCISFTCTLRNSSINS